MAKNVKRVFDRMVEDMGALEQDSRLLDDCIALSEDAIRRVPLRCRIIALGFVKGFTLEQLNEKLTQQGCPRLYVRSFWEATLVYAFRNGLGYEAWKALHQRCSTIFEEIERPGWFAGSRITYGELERYVKENSEAQGDVSVTQFIVRGMQGELMTRHLTELVNRKLIQVDDEDGLVAFLRENAEAFSPMREKTRYYFCKYLYYYLKARIESYFEACRQSRGVDEALAELLPLKVVTTLRRHHRMSEAEKREKIAQSAVSCGALFDAFNYFYFGYVSSSWVKVLMECYETAEEMPASARKRLAAVLRRGRPMLALMSDQAVIRSALRRYQEKKDSGEKAPKSRVGELTMYKYIQGTLDLDRTSLVCYLLFFAGGADMPEGRRLTGARLDTILAECGYARLDTEKEFDWFAEEFLSSAHPQDLLMDLVEESAGRGQNSFLYHVYGNPVNYKDELLRVMVGEA